MDRVGRIHTFAAFVRENEIELAEALSRAEQSRADAFVLLGRKKGGGERI